MQSARSRAIRSAAEMQPTSRKCRYNTGSVRSVPSGLSTQAGALLMGRSGSFRKCLGPWCNAAKSKRAFHAYLQPIGAACASTTIDRLARQQWQNRHKWLRHNMSRSRRAMVAAKLANMPAHRPTDKSANLQTSQARQGASGPAAKVSDEIRRPDVRKNAPLGVTPMDGGSAWGTGSV